VPCWFVHTFPHTTTVFEFVDIQGALRTTRDAMPAQSSLGVSATLALEALVEARVRTEEEQG
jgi:hypothetical protein